MVLFHFGVVQSRGMYFYYDVEAFIVHLSARKRPPRKLKIIKIYNARCSWSFILAHSFSSALVFGWWWETGRTITSGEPEGYLPQALHQGVCVHDSPRRLWVVTDLVGGFAPPFFLLCRRIRWQICCSKHPSCRENSEVMSHDIGMLLPQVPGALLGTEFWGCNIQTFESSAQILLLFWHQARMLHLIRT